LRAPKEVAKQPSEPFSRSDIGEDAPRN